MWGEQLNADDIECAHNLLEYISCVLQILENVVVCRGDLHKIFSCIV